MGVEEETGDGHRVYWPEWRVITVERSIKFNFDEEVVVGILPLEGEQPVVEQPIQPILPQPVETPVETPVEIPVETSIVPEIVIDQPNPVEETLGRGQRVRKESEYVRLLRQGTGTTSARPSDSLLPKGISSGSNEVGGVAVEDLAMATVMGSAEGIEPTYEEARRRPDWPKWQVAIQMELKNLKDSGTWKLVE